MKELTGRSAMKSPGAPSLRRDVEREFWREIGKGLTTEGAALAVGASQAAGTLRASTASGCKSPDVPPSSTNVLEQLLEMPPFAARSAPAGSGSPRWLFCGGESHACPIAGCGYEPVPQ